MSDYHISEISEHNRREMKQLDALLEKEGIRRDRNLDYTAGLYDDEYRLAATGSCFGNTLRCMAVDSSHQGEGLLNQVVSHLIDYEYGRGITDLFLYTKCDKALFFRDLGFYEIARAEGKVVFMENRKQGFSSYLARLQEETKEQRPDRQLLDKQLLDKQPLDKERGAAVELPAGTDLPVGAVILNANPFTLGHQYLIETAAAACGLLHVFVVSEDISSVPFDVRFSLVREGTKHIPNLVLHRTGSYMISNATFPSYFLKDEDTVIRSHAVLDIAVFRKIAAYLNITCRFVGEEPFSRVTGIYNQVMQEELSRTGLECRVIPRRETAGSGSVISASSVRSLIHDGKLEQIRGLVPESTYAFFRSPAAEDVVRRIREEEDVVHY